MEDLEKQLFEIHDKINFNNKRLLKKEIPEQLMVLKHLNENNKVLELGGSIGRNSCIINYLLKDKTNHVIIEPSKKELNILEKNRDINNFEYIIENSALSDVKLYSRGWNTYTEKVNKSVEVNIISYNKLINKYNINFDTLIVDCEGHFVNIIKTFPEILNNIKLINIEHDFNNEEDINYFYDIMKKNNFIMVDKMNKGEKYCPNINWGDGVKSDPIFISVWKKE